MSRTSWNDSLSSATLSEASIHSVPAAVAPPPSTSGRMPLRIAEAEDAVADDHGDDRVAAAAATVDARSAPRKYPPG